MRYETIPQLSVWSADSAAVIATGRVAQMAAAFQAGLSAKTPQAGRPPALNPIDELIGLYEKAWSPMAKRNLIADLEREITKYMRAHPADISMALVALRDVVLRVARSSPPTGKYSTVMCLGWTVGCNYKASSGHISRDSTRNPDYFRHSSDDQIDMARKCVEMVKAIKAARAAVAVLNPADNAATLKVFMAPEFYFRGQNGAYSPEIVSQILPLLKRDLGMGWDDWLFVFGTAIASIEDEVTYCDTCSFGNSTIRFEKDPADRTKTIPKCSKDTGVGPAHAIAVASYGAEVQNVALVHHAGESFVVAKEYVSGIDYKDNKVRVSVGTVDERNARVLAPQGSRMSRIKSLFNDERMGGCILSIAGLTVGLEVCLDHIASGLPDLGRASSYSSTIQLLLIPSYGMSIGGGLYCRTGGVIFNVDGRGTGSSEVAVKGAARPRRAKLPVNGGRGDIEVWEPTALPQ